MLFKDLFKVFLLTFFFKLKKGRGREGSQKPVRGFYEMYFHKPCCAGSAAGSFEFQVCTTQVIFLEMLAYQKSNAAFGS